jgi:hypothetical protein
MLSRGKRPERVTNNIELEGGVHSFSTRNHLNTVVEIFEGHRSRVVSASLTRVIIMDKF